MERDLQWTAAAKRFIWQASQGSAVKEGREEALSDKVLCMLYALCCVVIAVCAVLFVVLCVQASRVLLRTGAPQGSLLPSLVSLSCRVSIHSLPHSFAPTLLSPSTRTQIDVWLGDGASAAKLAEAAARLNGGGGSSGNGGAGGIDFLFLDGTPKETLDYLKAALPALRDGAVVVADNAGVFAEGGMKPYLEVS